MPYLGRSPQTGVRTRYIYTASGSQTLFSGADDNGRTLAYQDGAYVDVFLNGVCLVPTTDFTATTKTSVTLTSGATASDIVEIVCYDIASMADTVSKSQGGTFDGAVTVNGGLSVDGGTIKLDGNYPTGTGNVALGDAAMNGSISGNYNTALGDFSMQPMTSGASNTGVGGSALRFVTSGSYNTAVGHQSLHSNTTASYNTAVGYQSSYNNTTGIANASFGGYSLAANTTGQYNTALGYASLNANTTASYNTAVGYRAAYSSNGDKNNAFGRDSLYSNTSGTNNVAIGESALYSNTTASYNSSVGGESLATNTTGQYNTALGFSALRSNTTASNNTAVGFQAGYSLTTSTTSDNNTMIGGLAGYSSTTAINNTYVGYGAGYSMTTGDANTIVGRYNGNQGGLTITTSSNNIVLSDGDGNPRVYVNSSGHIMNQEAVTGMDLGFGHQALSIKATTGVSAAIFGQTNAAASTVLVYNSNTGCVTNIEDIRCARTQNSAYIFAHYRSGGSSDTEFYLRGDGQAYADGSWNGGGADYAEYFEWADGNPDNEDRRGYSVVLENSKMRKATTDDNPALIFGIISARPSMIGDADIGAWKSKYLKDDFGAYQRDENDERILNPDYDPDQEYTSREDRPEWDTVGLMGKLRIRKGQPTGSNWIKMRDVSDTVEEWLVR